MLGSKWKMHPREVCIMEKYPQLIPSRGVKGGRENLA